MLLILEHWITVLSFSDLSLVLLVLEVDLVFDEDVSAEVAWQVSGTFDANHEVNPAREELFRTLRQVVIRQLFMAILIDWHNIDL